MNREEIYETWWSYLKDELDPRTTAFPSELPYLFREPHCGTCSHWYVKEFGGKQIKGYWEKGEVVDTYSESLFYGWCKRFPPVQRSPNSSFNLFKKDASQINSTYDFPVVPHEQSCGEWNEGDWVKELINEI